VPICYSQPQSYQSLFAFGQFNFGKLPNATGPIPIFRSYYAHLRKFFGQKTLSLSCSTLGGGVTEELAALLISYKTELGSCMPERSIMHKRFCSSSPSGNNISRIVVHVPERDTPPTVTPAQDYLIGSIESQSNSTPGPYIRIQKPPELRCVAVKKIG
jgi:hypothetical protein